MVIGYKAEIEKQYKKDFNGFLNIAYNPWKNGDYAQTAGYGETDLAGGSTVVELLDAGDRTVEVIKIVREVTGLGLVEAKDLVETAPSVIKNGVSESEAANIKARLEEAGASVSLK
ncbi:MAG: ribosomal protein L7/L12 [Lachnospiraceae bacterium]|nr:ribosomal protein L7/L12 [Lachnospiraceae bacterium]